MDDGMHEYDNDNIVVSVPEGARFLYAIRT